MRQAQRFASIGLGTLLAMSVSLSAFADYYLEVTDADANHQAGALVERRINGTAYPNPRTGTTRVVRRFLLETPSFKTMFRWTDGVDTYVRSKLTAGEISAIVTSDPGGYTESYTKAPYTTWFDADRVLPWGKAIVMIGDSIPSSGNGGVALSEPDRMYYLLDGMVPTGSQVINMAVGGKTAAQLNSDFANQAATLNVPVGAELNLIIMAGGNDIITDSQTGWSAGSRVLTLVQTAKNAFPSAKIWVCTLPARKNGGTVSALKDFAYTIKGYANIEAKGYKVIDLADDVHFGIFSSSEPINNVTYYQNDLEHLTAEGNRQAAKYIKDALWPPSDIHPVLNHCGPWWRETVTTPGTPTYTTINENAQHGKGTGIRSGAADGLPSYYADPNNIVVAHNTDPVRDIVYPGSFNDRSPGSVQAPFDIRVPNSTEIADVVPPNTPNEPGVVYNEDTGVIWGLNTMCRVIPSYVDRLNAYPNCIHAGAGINAPPIFESEWDANYIPHKLAINLPAGYLKWNSGTSKGYLWPATNDDSGANGSTYSGTNSLLALGSTIAIPPEVTPESIGVTSAKGLAIFHAWQDYGAVVSDTISMNFNWHTFSFGIEKSREAEMNAIHGEIEAMGRVAKVVTY